MTARSSADPYSPRLPLLPALDGIRALAVAAVVLYHADMMWIPGGFIGVEIFFVISGYLITSLLLAEWRERGDITLHAFWLRRARRLLPAVYTLIAAVLVATVIAYPTEVAGLRGDAIASFVYVENWYLIFRNQSYFEAMGRLSMLRHLWSLAVEEQFYIVWPILLTLLLKLARRRIAVVAVLAVATTSAALMGTIYVPEIDPSRVYFGTDTRASSLLIGSALAFLWVPGRLPDWSARLPRWMADVIAVMALAALLTISLTINEFMPLLYRGGFVLISLSTAVLIAATTLPSAGLVGRGLGWAPLRWIGLRSYSIYLWHWPVVSLTRPHLDVAIEGLPLLAVRVAATLVLAELSYRYVETPIRRGAIGRALASWRRSSGRDRLLLGSRWAAVTIAAVAGVTVLGVQVATAQHPAPSDFSASSLSSLVAAPASELAGTPDSPEQAPADLGREVIVAGGDVTATPAPELLAVATAVSTGAPAATPSAHAATSTATATSGVAAPPGIPNRLPPMPTAPKPSPSSATARPSTETLSLGTAPGTGGAAAYLTPTPPAGTPAPTAAPVVVGRVDAFGDSVMLGASDELHRQIAEIRVDAAVSRQVGEVIQIMSSRAARGELAGIVVMHIGNNGIFTGGQLDEILRLVGPERRVVFLTVAVPRRWAGPNNGVIADGARRYPNVKVLDWESVADGRPELLWTDGIHLRPEGAVVYAQLIVSALK